jgi:alpha-L-fucosidase
LHQQRPIFWGECGVVSIEKLNDLLNRYRGTHFVFSKWGISLDPFAELIQRAQRGLRRTAPIELLRFPADAAQYIDDDGSIRLEAEQIERRRWPM